MRYIAIKAIVVGVSVTAESVKPIVGEDTIYVGLKAWVSETRQVGPVAQL